MSAPFRTLDREEALAQTVKLLEKAWASFDLPRPDQPDISDEITALLKSPLPEQGIDALDALTETDHILDQSISQPRPRYFAFVGSSGLEMGVLADMLASAHDINLAVYAGAASLLERQALRWVGELIGFPAQGGAFTSGGMLSNLTALTAAREYALPGSRENGIQQPVAVYISQDAHSSVERAVEVLGIGSRRLRDIPMDDQRRMDATKLAEQVEQDIADGITPIAIVATTGTTLAGAVDPLNQIADVAEKHNIWLHVDGAYGGSAGAAPSTQAIFAGLDRVTSVSVDAHKWLFLPKPCGVLLVRDQKTLTAAFTHDASYIREEADTGNPVNWTLEYSRPVRALKVWLALRSYGAQAFRAAIEKNMAQARLCAELVQQTPSLELLLEPQLSVVLFRHRADLPDLNPHNQRLVEALQADGRVFVAQAVADGQTWLRVCFVNYRTENDDIYALIDIVQEIGERLITQT